MVVHWHKLGEVNSECTSHNAIVLATFVRRIIKFGGGLISLTKNNFARVLFRHGAQWHKKAQLSLGKMDYSLYSSCCSIDLQGYPRSMISISSDRAICHFLLVINSNLGPISHHFRDMASFLLKNTHFPTPSIQPRIWKCSSHWNFNT